MSLVLDSSATLAWIYPDERPPGAVELLNWIGENGAIVPSIWRLEIINALLSARRRRRITDEEIDVVLASLLDLEITVDDETDVHAWSQTAEIAAQNGLTIYDACYVELALRRSLPIATFDREVRIAANALAIPLVSSPP